MKLLRWNCRGFAGKGKDGAIRNLAIRKRINFIGLVETKHLSVSAAKIRKWWEQMNAEWCVVPVGVWRWGTYLFMGKGSIERV